MTLKLSKFYKQMSWSVPQLPVVSGVRTFQVFVTLVKTLTGCFTAVCTCSRSGCWEDGETGVQCHAGLLPESDLQGGEDAEEQQEIHHIGCSEERSALHQQVRLAASHTHPPPTPPSVS